MTTTEKSKTIEKRTPRKVYEGFQDTYFIIMAGGKGERFWPLSTEHVPKPFVRLTGKKTLIELTVDRAKRVVPIERIFVVLGKEHLPEAKKCLPGLPGKNFIIEPVNRDTAPCVGLAALLIHLRAPEAVMVVLPSDHHVTDEGRFAKLIRDAVKVARRGEYLVTIGVKPDRPETGYGYVKAGKKAQAGKGVDCFHAARFVEKPQLAKAKHYFREGSYYWNTGIFIWKVPVLLEGLRLHMPRLHRGLEDLRLVIKRREWKKANELFAGFDRESIDYGLMEKAKNVLMIPATFGWDDVGTWTALLRVLDTDEKGNLLRGRAVAIDTDNCVIIADKTPVALLGLSNLVVVASKEGILVCEASKAQEVRRIAKLFNKKS